jgi:hypothetical protein
MVTKEHFFSTAAYISAYCWRQPVSYIKMETVRSTINHKINHKWSSSTYFQKMEKNICGDDIVSGREIRFFCHRGEDQNSQLTHPPLLILPAYD